MNAMPNPLITTVENQNDEIHPRKKSDSALSVIFRSHHEGQVIRHVYGLEGTLPKSWKWA